MLWLYFYSANSLANDYNDHTMVTRLWRIYLVLQYYLPFTLADVLKGSGLLCRGGNIVELKSVNKSESKGTVVIVYNSIVFIIYLIIHKGKKYLQAWYRLPLLLYHFIRNCDSKEYVSPHPRPKVLGNIPIFGST